MKITFKMMVLAMGLWLATIPQLKAQQRAACLQNPILAGDNPDPSILKDGDHYYLVHSSFEYYPGLLIWQSSDLVNWQPLTNALKTYVGSVWAPDLVKYEGKYYIYFPAQNTNFVIVADDIAGPWSEPIDLKVGNIDPGHIADDAGNRYLYFSNGGYVQLAKDGLSVISELKNAYAGWEIPREWSIECFCMEGPKLFKKGDYYYLTVAEGGTAGPATGHMVVSARSKSPLGPWENSPYNPIIRTKDVSDHWWSVGHATIFDGKGDDAWMIFHGYEKDYYNMGRQTLLQPIEWTADGWFKLPEGAAIDAPLPIKVSGKDFCSKVDPSDDFKGSELNPLWKSFGGYEPDRYTMTGEGLVIAAKGNGVVDSQPFLCTPQDHDYEASVEIEIEGEATAGLVLFYSHKAYSGILADQKSILANLRGWQFETEKDVHKRHVFLRLKNERSIVDMYYSLDGKEWIKIENSADVTGYHHNVLSDFLSLKIGLCAIGDGKVTFSNFKYQAIK